MKAEVLVYTIDPAGLAFWIPDTLAALLKVKRGDRLTREQYSHPEVERLRAGRRASERKGGTLIS